MIRLDSTRAERGATGFDARGIRAVVLNIQVVMSCQWNTYLRFFALIFLGDLHDRQFMLVPFSGSAFLPWSKSIV